MFEGKYILRESVHVRWNVQKSPDNFECVRYLAVFVDNQRRENNLDELLHQIQRMGGSITDFRRRGEGRVRKSDFRYLFVSFDTKLAEREINWSKLTGRKKRNPKLYERIKKRCTVEDYVTNFYERS